MAHRVSPSHPFPTGHHRDDETCARVREYINPILERHAVHLVLAGHEHAYERSAPRRNGTVYITTGGGGSRTHAVEATSIVPIAIPASHFLRLEGDGPRLTIRAIGLDGAIDQFELSAAPVLPPDAVRNAATFSTSLAVGGLISIFGHGLALGTAQASATRLPRELEGVEVSVGDRALPLLFVSRDQVNAQIPYEAAVGNATLTVRAAGGSVTQRLSIAAAAPAIFLARPGDPAWPAVIHLDGRLVESSAPAAAGEWLSMYLTGLGALATPLTTGEVSSVPISSRQPVRVQLGSLDAEVYYAGVAPSLVGVNQINFRVPPGIGPGLVPLRVIAAGAASQTVELVVR